MLVGAHVPTFGDYRKVAAYAAQTGCECVQVFSCSPRSWACPQVTQKTLDQLAEARADAAAPLPPMLVHAGYLINLASDDPDQLAKSRDSLAGEIARAWVMGADALNVHTGSSRDFPREKVPWRIAYTVFEAYAKACDLVAKWTGGPAPALPVVFEDTAGAGTTYGTTMAELGAILRELDALGFSAGLAGVCIDTCHAWAAGYDVSCEAGWLGLLGEVEQECGGLGRLRWIHANDCKHGRGERKDRHEWIGRGCIGPAGFEAMVRLPQLAHVNVAVEMPGEMPEKDAVNVALLKGWRDGTA